MLSEEAYSQLKKMIVSGKFEKEQRSVDEKFVLRVNASKNPV